MISDSSIIPIGVLGIQNSFDVGDWKVWVLIVFDIKWLCKYIKNVHLLVNYYKLES